MVKLGRRSVLAGASALSLPYIANAAATTATVWQVQGFVPEEDAAFRRTVADYEKVSGNKIEYSIMPFMALNQKAISALTSGDVPDLIFHQAPETILPQNAWDDRLADMTDVVDTQKDKFSHVALQCASYFNSKKKARSFYLVPAAQACEPFHIWGDLVEQAGFKLSDAPKTWDAFWDFFKPMQKPLRAKGHRRIYALGLQVTTVGPNDGNNVFLAFTIANGGKDIVTSDGKLNSDDPKVREAAIKAAVYMAKAYQDGYVPPEAMSWNDADDNNGFHEKAYVVDFDGTISTEVAMIHNKENYDACVTMGLPNGNDGQPVPALVGCGGGFVPKGAKNEATAKDFMKYFIRPEVMNQNLKEGLGRWLPTIPEIVKTDPFWLDPKDPHLPPYVQEGVLGPSIPTYNAYNPAWGQVQAEQLWTQTVADIIKSGMKPEAAVDKAFKRAESIFTKFTFG